MGRPRLLTLILLAVTLASLPALRHLELLGQRESYRLLETAGVLKSGGSYWGQILRYNIPKHPEWMRTWIRVASGAGAYAAVVAAAVAVGTVLVFGVRTLGPDAGRAGRAWRPMRYAWPLAGASLIFGLVLSLTYDRVDHWVYEGLYDLADALGCQYMIISGIRPMMYGSGPFHGETAADVLNWFYVHGYPLAPLIVPLLAATGAFWWLSPRRSAGSDGVCDACGYSLEGLAGCVCPECGNRSP